VSGHISKRAKHLAIGASIVFHAALLAAFVYFVVTPILPTTPTRLAEIEILPAVNPLPKLAEPEPPDPPEPPERPRVVKPKPRQVANATNAMALLPPAELEPAAPPPPSTAAQPGPPPDYLARLSAKLERNKKYPSEARRQKIEGIVLIRFTIRRDGSVASCTLARSSGNALLDEEAVSLPERAGPFPPIPDEIAGEQLELTVPVTFSRKNRATS
jgi:periplasmic protein TonB